MQTPESDALLHRAASLEFAHRLPPFPNGHLHAATSLLSYLFELPSQDAFYSHLDCSQSYPTCCSKETKGEGIPLSVYLMPSFHLQNQVFSFPQCRPQKAHRSGILQEPQCAIDTYYWKTRRPRRAEEDCTLSVSCNKGRRSSGLEDRDVDGGPYSPIRGSCTSDLCVSCMRVLLGRLYSSGDLCEVQ